MSGIKVLWHYAEARRLAQLLALQALQSARVGNTNEALSDVRAIFRMSDHLKNEPVLIGFLVARFVYSVAINTLADVLQTSPIPAAPARSFLASLPTADWSATYRHKLLAERTFTIWGFNSASSNWLQQYTGNENIAAAPTWLSKPLALLWAPLLKLDEVYALRLWKRTIAAVTPMQVPSPPDANELIEQQLRDAPRYALVTRTLFPVYASARQLRDSIEVWQRQMEIALALSSYHSLHGRYPARLQEAEAVWGKALAPDPYSNKPFQYRSDGRNFTLYSVGINRIDDGGGTSPARYSDNSPNPGDDIVWNPKH